MGTRNERNTVAFDTTDDKEGKWENEKEKETYLIPTSLWRLEVKNTQLKNCKL